ncbi:domain of Kin17 curved DNA-binding protein-domain-containing protein [Scheffersomyces coipomensis]|uniref:domain of Kin17 curved DNA-binding protein-domain-containing protein n=1 Tax=Scheffersomyces coipomensis TaxID=1788519 RepID=UPI00315C97CE
MARAEIGTAKYQSKKLKASGLQKLKFYCQICPKQCRDENGFKNHLSSPSHLGKVSNVTSSTIQDYSTQFETDFLRLLKVNHGIKKINANKFYQEYILNDKDHVHMNTTKWNSLTSFIKHLGQTGSVRVESDNASGGNDDEFNLSIRLIDHKSDYEKNQQDKSSKSLKSDEGLSMKLINEQIKRGKLQSQEPESQPPITLPTNVGPIKLSLKSKLQKKPITKIRSSTPFDNSDDDDEEEQ